MPNIVEDLQVNLQESKKYFLQERDGDQTQRKKQSIKSTRMQFKMNAHVASYMFALGCSL